jgi:ribosomal protein L30/L7E
MELIRELDEEKWAVAKTLEALGLTRAKDTFVGEHSM